MAAYRVSVVFAIFAIQSVLFLFLVICELAPAAWAMQSAGWLGILMAAVALYGSVGVLINSTFGRPLFHMGAAKMPPTGMHAVEH